MGYPSHSCQVDACLPMAQSLVQLQPPGSSLFICNHVMLKSLTLALSQITTCTPTYQPALFTLLSLGWCFFLDRSVFLLHPHSSSILTLCLKVSFFRQPSLIFRLNEVSANPSWVHLVHSTCCTRLKWSNYVPVFFLAHLEQGLELFSSTQTLPVTCKTEDTLLP